MPTMTTDVMRSHTVFQSSMLAGNLRSDLKRTAVNSTTRQQTAEMVEKATCALATSESSLEMV